MSGIVFGKLALVTGAGSGIGRATCRVLAREGAKIVATDRNETTAKDTINDILKDYRNDHTGLKLNVNDSESVKNAFDEVQKLYKQPATILVNCAGITRDNFLLKLSEQDFDEVIDVNLKGTFLMMQAFAKILVENEIKNSSIVNISSIVGKYGNIGQCNYSASKAGVELITKTAAKEFGKFGIRCNVILPGFIKSPMTETIPDKVKSKVLSTIACGRFGEPQEVAETILFLASDKSSYVNGASIEVTGGI